MEKVVKLPQAEVVMSIWDLGGSKSFLDLLPMVCVEAVAICFAFDLSDKSSLEGVKEWYRQARELNATALPFLVGTKFDKFYTMDKAEQDETTSLARKYARAMRAPLVYTSSSYGINVQKLMKLVFCTVFQLPVSVKEKKKAGEPLLEYKKALTLQDKAAAAEAGGGAVGTEAAAGADPGAGTESRAGEAAAPGATAAATGGGGGSGADTGRSAGTADDGDRARDRDRDRDRDSVGVTPRVDGSEADDDRLIKGASHGGAEGGGR